MMPGSRLGRTSLLIGCLGLAGCVVLGIGLGGRVHPRSVKFGAMVACFATSAAMGVRAWRVGRMGRFVDVCGVEDVAEGKGLGLTVDGLEIAVFRDGDRYHALLGRCPHADAPMGRGWVEDGEAVCPIHQWRFKLSTGRCTTMPGRSLHKFRCKVADGRVWVEV